MSKFIVKESELYFSDDDYQEEYNTLEEAQERMKEMYHNVAFHEEAIERAELNERSAIVYVNDGNEIYWDIEEVE